VSIHTLAVIVVVTAAAGCRPLAGGVALRDGFPTKEAAAQAVLDAVWMRDEGRLLDLAIGEEEFRTIVWPRLPASHPDVGMPVDYLWRDTSGKSRARLAAVLREYGGQRFHLHAVSYGGPPTDYGTFRIHPKTVLTVADQNRRATMRLFGSMIEAGGRWKIYGFLVD
jgi:hypothetical protein